MLKIVFETERLRLRRWTDDDLKDFIAINQDPEVMIYFPDLYTVERSCEIFRLIQEEFQTHGYSLFAVDEKSSGTFIGYVGLHHTKLNLMPEEIVEVGWRLKKEFWNKGYATEAAKVCLDYAFTKLKLPEVYSFTAEINTPSRRVMEKLGMSFVQCFLNENVKEGHPLQQHVLYKISNQNVGKSKR